MGKVTIKHILNTRSKKLNPDNYDSELFQLYVLITINRKTTQIKSLLDVQCTPREFDFLRSEQGENQEVGTLPFVKSLAEEKKLISLALALHEQIHNEKYDISKGRLKEDILKLSIPANILFAKAVKQQSQKCTGSNIDTLLLLQIIKDDIPLRTLQDIIAAATGVDITTTLSDESRQLWHTAQELDTISDTTKPYPVWLAEELPRINSNLQDIENIVILTDIARTIIQISTNPDSI